MPREFIQELRGDVRKEAIDIYDHIDPKELRGQGEWILIETSDDKNLMPKDVKNAAQSLDHNRITALDRRVRPGDAVNIPARPDEGRPQPAPGLIFAGSAGLCSHRLGANPGVGREPDCVGPEFLPIPDDGFSQDG